MKPSLLWSVKSETEKRPWASSLPARDLARRPVMTSGLLPRLFDARWTPGPWSSRGGHIIDAMAIFLSARGIDVLPVHRKPALPSPSPRTPASPTIVLNPNAGSNLKEAPVNLWVDIANDLVGTGYVRVVLRGLDGGMSEDVCRHVPEARLVVTPDVPALARLLSASDLVISPDTGVLYLAAAFSVPYLGLFGSTDPHFLGPYDASPEDIVVSRAHHADVCCACWTAQLLPRAACSMKYEPNCLSHPELRDVLPRIHAKLAARLDKRSTHGIVAGVSGTGLP